MADRSRVLPGLVAWLRGLDAALPGKGETGGGRPAALSGDPVRGLARLWRGLLFGTTTRAETWQLLADVTEAGVDPGGAVETLIKAYRRQGRTGRALVLAEMRTGLLDGNAAERLAPYVSAPERLLLDGLGKQEASAVFGGAARLLRNRLALRKALLEAVAMPLLLCAGLLAMVLFFGLELLPAFAEIVDFETLPPLQDIVVTVTLAVSGSPLALFWWIAGIVAALAALMRFWTGTGRALADRFPPFSVVRLQAGTGFLFALTEYGRAGVGIKPSLLEDMAAATGRYEASRIRALVPHFERTENMGTAALEAGQGFPDDELAVALQVLWNEKEGVKRSGEFLERRLERIEGNVKARMAVLNAALMVAIAAALLALMSVALPLIDQLNAAMAAA
ncbi:MAG: hypothetical protein F4213_13265 [Boseongicola sp. SB0677_bin_26]|nr:hypothetical protein [Boseongicola sp. SB0677_bin_26]